MFGAGDTETVTIIRPPGQDPFGDPLPGTGGETPVDGCLFAPGPTQENNDGATRVDSDGTLYAPSGADINASDRLRIRGDVYEVIGRPRVWGCVGVEVVLKRSTG